MTRLEKCELAISKGITYNELSGDIVGVKGGVLKKKVNGYISITLWNDLKRHYLYAHQFAWYVTHKEIVELIDHKNKIKTDNRIDNLRVFNKQLNALNTNSKGCCFDKRCGKWMSSIMISGKSKFLGYFDNEDDATNKYKKYKEELIIKLNNNGSSRSD